MKISDLLSLMDDLTQLDINAQDFEEHIYITDMSKMPKELLNREIDYIGAKCEDCLMIFLKDT